MNPLVAIFVRLSEILGARWRAFGSMPGSAAQVRRKFHSSVAQVCAQTRHHRLTRFRKTRCASGPRKFGASLCTDTAPPTCAMSKHAVRVESVQVWRMLWHKLGISERQWHKSLRTPPGLGSKFGPQQVDFTSNFGEGHREGTKAHPGPAKPDPVRGTSG